MKYLLLFVFSALALFAQQGGNGCDANAKPQEANVLVSTNTATVLVPASTGVIHLCTVAFSTATATSVSFRASDNTLLWSSIQNVTTMFTPFQGILTTRRATTGSSLQIIFSVAPAAPAGVFVSYYITQD